MNKLISILTLLALTLTVSMHAQPGDGPRERPDRDRESQRERGDRPDRPGDRFRPGDREHPRDGERGERPGKREPLSVDQIEEALETVRAMHGDATPPWIKGIEKLVKEDPEAAAKALSRFPRIRDMMHARKNKPEEFALHTKQSLLMRELLPMVRELKQAQKQDDQAKVDELKPKVREHITQLFQHRLKLKELEIKQIRAKLAAAEKELVDIQADSEALIDEKMNEIMTSTGPRGPREEGDSPKRDDHGPKSDRPDRK
ncbi:MAG: hypothetical protein ACPG4Q_00735 [Phycisphaeraceae bacterium]